uniref:Uncharacterized protein n=1 Tax=Mola mola TaxID=94237 RepID=A0A3Q3VQV7_MOLML
MDKFVSREKVVCVCQALLDCRVFEAVGTKVFGKDQKQDVFRDSKSALYRQSELTCPTVAHTPMSIPVKSTRTSINADHLHTPATASLSLGPLLDSLNMSCLVMLCFPVVEEVWREQTLLRLLNLMELPLLEGLLQCSQTPLSHRLNTLTYSHPDLIYSSNHLDRQILKAFRDSQKDEWLCAALDCLDLLPDQPVVELSRELPPCFLQDQDSYEQLPYKLLLYESLAKHYNHTDRPPLLPQHMTDIYTAITDLLVNAKLSLALEALQLCLKLLPPTCRDELRRLLTFMALAADPQGIKLDKEMENRLAVKRSFFRAILHNKALSKDKEDLMVVFMLSNIKEIFKIPGALHKGVSDKLASLAEGKQPDLTGSTFCQQVPSRTYIDSSRNITKQELLALLNSIHLNTKISTKERKHQLGQFYQAHPEIFNQYFGESAVNVL